MRSGATHVHEALKCACSKKQTPNMSKYFSRLHSRARKNPFHFASRIMPTHRTARLLVPAFVVIMGIGYVVIGNLTTAKAYELRRVESSLVELRAENRRLELEVVKSTAAQS